MPNSCHSGNLVLPSMPIDFISLSDTLQYVPPCVCRPWDCTTSLHFMNSLLVVISQATWHKLILLPLTQFVCLWSKNQNIKSWFSLELHKCGKESGDGGHCTIEGTPNSSLTPMVTCPSPTLSCPTPCIESDCNTVCSAVCITLHTPTFTHITECRLKCGMWCAPHPLEAAHTREGGSWGGRRNAVPCEGGCTGGWGNSLRHYLAINLLVQPADDCTRGNETDTATRTGGGDKGARMQPCTLPLHWPWDITESVNQQLLSNWRWTGDEIITLLLSNNVSTSYMPLSIHTYLLLLWMGLLTV